MNTQKDGTLIKDSVDLRIAPASDEAQTQRLINDYHIENDYVFGNTCAFTPGQMQALLRTQTNNNHGTLSDILDAYDIREARARDGHEYVGGICYWLAIEDHFYQIQHVSLQAKQMEEYFTWLLREQTNTVNINAFVELACQFDSQQVGGDLDDISSIEIGGIAPETIYQPSEPTPDEALVEDIETTETVGSESAYFDKARDVLEALVGSIGTQRIMDEIPDEASLEVKVNIGYKAKKRKFNKEFMGNIASGLRNLPDGEMRVRGRSGEMRGTDIRLSEDMSVKKVSDGSSLLDMEHALEQMLEVHRRFVHDGKI
ncbi:hypothetical protein [Roseovarius sp. EL26]|uniref:hypothetical protein n=1 Tax=Roseovarius sp. EL26 TaxID=2126672 RepID=UPI0013C4EFED|nr:hypothetical protein [Roseovarius sp. EL26]